VGKVCVALPLAFGGIYSAAPGLAPAIFSCGRKIQREGNRTAFVTFRPRWLERRLYLQLTAPGKTFRRSFTETTAAGPATSSRDQ